MKLSVEVRNYYSNKQLTHLGKAAQAVVLLSYDTSNAFLPVEKHVTCPQLPMRPEKTNEYPFLFCNLWTTVSWSTIVKPANNAALTCGDIWNNSGNSLLINPGDIRVLEWRRWDDCHVCQLWFHRVVTDPDSRVGRNSPLQYSPHNLCKVGVFQLCSRQPSRHSPLGFPHHIHSSNPDHIVHNRYVYWCCSLLSTNKFTERWQQKLSCLVSNKKATEYKKSTNIHPIVNYWVTYIQCVHKVMHHS